MHCVPENQMKTGDNKKPFTCIVCGKGFTTDVQMPSMWERIQDVI